jgi:hypothetical protein
MSLEEAGKTFSGQGLTTRENDRGQKWFTESRGKAEKFKNKGDKTPEDKKVVVRYKLDNEEYSNYRKGLTHQAGARESKTDLWHREKLKGDKGGEGTTPSKEPINIGVQLPNNVSEFNRKIKYGSVKKVKK